MSVSTYMQAQCSICLDPLLPPLQKADTACRHTFHKICLEEWLKKGDSCPLCRHSLITFLSVEEVIRAAQRSQSEFNELRNRHFRIEQIKRNEKSRIEELNIEEIKKEYAELQSLNFCDDFSLMRLRLLKNRIETDQREKKSQEDFIYSIILVVAFCLLVSLPNAKPKAKT